MNTEKERLVKAAPELTGGFKDAPSGPDPDGNQYLEALADGESVCWSGPGVLPTIGAKVEVFMNGFGKCEVTGYFVSYGFLGFLAKPLNPPKWFIEQNDARGWSPAGYGIGWFFGCDLIQPVRVVPKSVGGVDA